MNLTAGDTPFLKAVRHLLIYIYPNPDRKVMRYTGNDAFGDVPFNFNLYSMHRKNIPRTMYATITNVYTTHTLRLRDAILPFHYK